MYPPLFAVRNLHHRAEHAFDLAVGDLDIFVRPPPLVFPFLSIAIEQTTYMNDTTARRIWNAMATVGIAVFYFPQSQVRSQKKTIREILPKVDFIGALLSIGGLTLLYVFRMAHFSSEY